MPKRTAGRSVEEPLPRSEPLPHSAAFKSRWRRHDCADCWKLQWADEFDSSCVNGHPDPNTWWYEHGFVRNGEPQYYTPNNTKCVEDDEGNRVVAIEADRLGWNTTRNALYQDPPDDPRCRFSVTPAHQQPDWCAKHHIEYIHYTSSSMRTHRSIPFGFGQYDARIRIPTSAGAWPAWWMVGSGEVMVGSTRESTLKWPANGEVDILEYYDGGLHANFMYKGGPSGEQLQTLSKVTKQRESDNWSEHYHLYSFVWTESFLEVFFDETSLYRIRNWEDLRNPTPTNPWSGKQMMSMILNVALGRKTDPDDAWFPITMEVDYVRYYARTPPPPSPSPSPPSACHCQRRSSHMLGSTLAD